jgi:hypothetical protein
VNLLRWRGHLHVAGEIAVSTPDGFEILQYCNAHLTGLAHSRWPVSLFPKGFHEDDGYEIDAVQYGSFVQRNLFDWYEHIVILVFDAPIRSNKLLSENWYDMVNDTDYFRGIGIRRTKLPYCGSVVSECVPFVCIEVENLWSLCSVTESVS